ncbi:DNA replication regulator SLD2 [Ceratocystis platani]|uniref:DNA replication regulator SLD2 n=1 Tax=Ceratocystis fimbriata f. sp. platani TaxID=88771 RepID=A0A0F8CST4_CERFI|nr:DNA replication regulator SLD2 [Ceratocystis platani]
MSLLSVHLEQIQLCCEGINSLPFPPPRIFTNALLSNHDITSLIRDTEPHERALFSVPPTKKTPSTATFTSNTPGGSGASESDAPGKSKSRRQTVFNVASGEVTTGPPTSRAAPRRNTAVAAVLGGELHDQLRRGERGTASARSGAGGGDVDVEVLLRGAEKLCTVYSPAGVAARISQIRNKHANLANTMAYYENKVAEQSLQLEAMNKDWMDEDGMKHEEEEEENENDSIVITEEDLRAEEEEVRELDRKKRDLQNRLRAMEKDLGGLNAMTDNEWAELKSWESKYAERHNGQKPSREAIKASPDIAAKYKQYNNLRDVLSGKRPKQKSPKAANSRPTESHSASPRKYKQAILVTPSKTRVQHFQTPTRTRIAQPDFLTPTTKRLTSPEPPSTIGPTPQRDGRVLGLFDLMSDTEYKSPSKVGFADISTPQKRKLDETDDDSVFSRTRTPMSASKRQMLDSFLTPTKRLGGPASGSAIGTTPKSASKDFSTPLFLKRRTAPIIFDKETELTSPSPSLRKVEEEAYEDDEEAMRAMEAAEFEDLPSRPVHPSPPKFERKPLQQLTTPITGSEEPEDEYPVQDSLDNAADLSASETILDSQPRLRLLSGFDDVNMYDTDQEKTSKGRTSYTRYKKRKPKRTTRKVTIKPTIYQRPADAAGDDSDVIPETQPQDPALLGPDSDGEFVDINDENVPPPPQKAHHGRRKKTSGPTSAGTESDAIQAKKPQRKVNELAHANFKRLKLRNYGAKGGPSFNSKYRRRR